MTSIGSVGANSAMLMSLQQQLFNEIDTTGSGSITKTSLEQAVTLAGGTSASADALYAQLDPNNTGSVSEQQFEQNLPAAPFSPEMGSQLMGYQANGWPRPLGGGGREQLAASLFAQIDTGGTGSITEASLEKAVTAAGGTKAAADALYAKLDPNNTGSVSEQQFVQALSKAGHRHCGGGDKDGPVGALAAMLSSSINAGTVSSSSTQDQIVQDLFSQIDTTGSGTITKSSLERAVTAAGGSSSSADALYAKLDPNNTGSVTEQQFAQVLTQPLSSDPGRYDGSQGGTNDALATLVGSSGVATSTSRSPEQIAQALFGAIDADGTGSITKSSLEQAVTADGGTASSADELYAQLDPTNSGSINEQQFVDALLPPSAQGDTAADAVLALSQNAQSQPSATIPTTALSSNSPNTATSALDELMAALSNLSDYGTQNSGGGAQNALASLMQPTQGGAWSSSAPSPFDFASAISQYQQGWSSAGIS